MKPFRGFFVCFVLFFPATSTLRAQDAPQKAIVVPISWVRVRGWQVPMLRIALKDNKPVVFALDTGTTYSLIDREIALPLGFPTETNDTGGHKVEFITCPADIGPSAFRITAIPLVLADLKSLRQVVPELAGVLGENVVEFVALRLDFSGKHMELIYPGKVAGTENEPSKAQRLPLLKDGDDYFVEGQVDGHPTRFMIGTGTETTLMGNHTLLAAIKPKAQLEGYKTSAAEDKETTLKEVATRLLRLQKIKIGTYEWSDPVVKQRLLKKTGDHNALGLDFLARFHVLLDFPGRSLYLTPDTAYQENKNAWLGIGVDFQLTSTSQLFIQTVVKPSPAYSAGLLVEDEVLEFNGHPSSQMTPEQLLSLTSSLKEGDEVTLKVQGKGDTRIRVFRLKVCKLI